MKLRTMLYGLTLMLGCFVLASCVNDEEGPCLPDGKTQVLFKLVLQDNAQTRAEGDTWGNYSPKKAGEGYDNQIDLPNVQMLLFDADGGYAGKLNDLTYSQTSENVYQYIGIAPEDLATGGYKFVILANAPTVTPTSLSDEALANLEFNYLGAETLPNIPMWGTKGVNADTQLTVEAGTRQDIGAISLLRAVSKVTVKLTGSDEDLKNYKLQKVTVNSYNTKGFVLPAGYANVIETTELGTESESLHANASAATAALVTEAAEGAKEITFYLPEYVNSADAPAEVIVTLTKEVEISGETRTITFESPIQFCKYADGVPATGADAELYNITRNHYYQFNITQVSDDGKLYVNPTVAPWIDAEELEYKIDASTNMRLFDSWLYRYDTDGDVTPENYTNWATSHMLVSSNVDADSNPANRPLQSPQIQLVTSGSSTFELYVDNSDFEIIRAIKNDVGVVTEYQTSTDGTLTIESGTDVYTYFYIMPKSGVTPANPVAKVFLYYDDPVLGKQEMTYNYSSLPGYSDDSSEIWVYYVAPEEYKYVEGSVLKMYYQDVNHPLVPTPVQN
ncbi:MAG: FimB/Mfa2 family fimbrial subunit [Bacteroidaceae bacterium]|nr:FimB/Mfa2 family fimbrial subunit [Bacteroidaceae bacterium]